MIFKIPGRWENLFLKLYEKTEITGRKFCRETNAVSVTEAEYSSKWHTVWAYWLKSMLFCLGLAVDSQGSKQGKNETQRLSESPKGKKHKHPLHRGQLHNDSTIIFITLRWAKAFCILSFQRAYYHCKPFKHASSVFPT